MRANAAGGRNVHMSWKRACLIRWLRANNLSIDNKLRRFSNKRLLNHYIESTPYLFQFTTVNMYIDEKLRKFSKIFFFTYTPQLPSRSTRINNDFRKIKLFFFYHINRHVILFNLHTVFQIYNFFWLFFQIFSQIHFLL